MTKNKRPSAAKAAPSPEDQHEVLTEKLAALAVELSQRLHRLPSAEILKEKTRELQKTIRKCVSQKKDDVLHEALEHALDDGADAYRLLKESIEEAAGTIVIRRDDGRELEVNAFVIPMFVHTTGGLHVEQCFQDEEAFDLLRKSVQEAQLESRDATVVLVSHAYHPDEIDRIRYGELHEMVREAFDSMTRKKTSATAIGRSMSGWPENHFAPDDQAVELRFLLGFALKTMDDPFYRVPENEAAADRYFEKRAERFRHWAQQVAPWVKRCLATDGRNIDIDFFYQDLFHGGKERGMAEYETLQMMSDLQHRLDSHGSPAENTRAVIGPADDASVVRVNLYAADDALLASADRPLNPGADVQTEIEDVCDALQTIGVKAMMQAKEFDSDGNPVSARPYANR